MGTELRVLRSLRAQTDCLYDMPPSRQVFVFELCNSRFELFYLRITLFAIPFPSRVQPFDGSSKSASDGSDGTDIRREFVRANAHVSPPLLQA